ncbi:DMSO/TMAO reductase YedYZ heme-binding membrane subunit [Actinoplanes lutulentus]|uniref:Ferric reductase like protein n=1 Tax=Actinoplanes lutulentus TaxID=1287878 RepID=A0A327ZK03_9ACTN|nr:ferric reductase-like transmembrane domain-containing protein [Actinoplanes lutulentus]MBB2944202.1 DMSO/TMAO reductase YedYZ heme-binding membrane subunit [Actinoplanes lutulentus]RAK42565.1 ferric reductase like protein [Actinoplanes lutulentus]
MIIGRRSAPVARAALWAFLIFWLAVLHPVFVILGFARYDQVSFPRTALSLSRQLPVLLGVIAVALIVLVVALSVRAARRRLSYEAWHAVHLLLYAALTRTVVAGLRALKVPGRQVHAELFRLAS